LLVSLVLHAIGYGTYRVGPAIAAAVRNVTERVLPRKLTEMSPDPARAERPPNRPVPMVFVEVDPSLAVPEPPDKTKNYSTHNTLAANPEPKTADVPKIDGTQKKILRTVDVPKPEPHPLQPAPIKKADEPKPADANPKPRPEVGDLAMARVEAKPLQPNKGDGDKEAEKPRERPRERVRTLAKLPGGIAGPKMQQDGGVPRRGRISPDAEGTAFGDYDRNLILAVQAAWWNAIEESKYDGRGTVRVAFVLHADGRVSNLAAVDTTVNTLGTTLCQLAIDKPKNYGEWPKAMLQHVGKPTREITFTFYYE